MSKRMRRTRQDAIEAKREIADAPRRVKPPAQSDISSLTKRSKGVENTPVPLSLLRIGGGDGGREEEAGADMRDGSSVVT